MSNRFLLLCFALAAASGLLQGSPDALSNLQTAIKLCEEGLDAAAIPLLQQTLKEKPRNDHAQFQLGLAFFHQQQLAQAKASFALVSPHAEDPQPYVLAQLYLARIALLDRKTSEADRLLNQAALHLPKEDPLYYELSYLRGEAFFQSGDYIKSAEQFEISLPKRNTEKAAWYAETLYHLGWSYLKIGDTPQLKPDLRRDYLDKAEAAFQKLMTLSADEKTRLALGQCYLARADQLNEKEALEQAEKVLASPVFASKEAQTHALLLRAQAAPTYETRDKLYRQLTSDSNKESPHYAKGLILRALNDCGLGENRLLEANYFQKLEALIREEDSLIQTLVDPAEIYYLRGLMASKIAKHSDSEKFADEALNSLRKVITDYPKSKYADATLHLLGIRYYQLGDYAKAQHYFLEVPALAPSSQYAGEDLCWAANCGEYLKQDPAKIKEYRKLSFEKYPDSPLAAESYFHFYSYQEYLENRAALKHLQAFPVLYPKSLYLMNAYYLLGLDNRQDRKTPEGKLIHKRNLTAAIDAFQEVESAFDSFMENQLLPEEKVGYYISLRYRATLERAIANLEIAKESQAAKRRIYLEYAEEVLRQMLRDFEEVDHPLTRKLKQQENYPHFEQEASYWLAQTYIQALDDASAKAVLNQMLEKSRSAKITRGYFLSRAWYEKGLIDFRAADYASALECLLNAEDASKGKLLSTEQKLDLWIQQSACYRALDKLDDAIVLLSKVVNDDAISQIRLKAMLLRAEIYEKQGRTEVARKQLEAIAKKGGEWAQKAKEKLDKDYGYQ